MGFADTLQRLGLLPDRPSNGNGGRTASASSGPGAVGVAAEQKGITLIDGRNLTQLEPNIQFFSPDSTRTIFQIIGGGNSESERVSRETAYAASAYCFAAIRYRAHAVADAPLMVVEEDDKGVETWLDTHPLDLVLDEPSPDFDMGELLARKVIYQDITGSALWLKELDGLARVGGFTPFAGNEFEVLPTSKRIRGQFRLTNLADGGEKTFDAERCIYFHEINPSSWTRGTSLVDVALGWLNLGQAARRAVQDILRNSLFPSVIVQAHQEWHPDKPEHDAWKAALDAYALSEKRGGPLGIVGGGSATRVSLSLKDLIPSDILDRVESVVASVFGIPAIILQNQVGIENSPWSNIEQAYRICYTDTISRLWRNIEKQLTRQLLHAPLRPGGRPLETNRRRKIKFDTSDVAALQPDKLILTQIAQGMGRAASLNERREIMLLEPSDNPKADEIPELVAPSPAELLRLGGAAEEDPDANSEENADDSEKRRRQTLLQQKRDWRADVLSQIRRAAEFDWELAVTDLLETDRQEIVVLAEKILGGRKEAKPKQSDVDRFRDELVTKLQARQAAWKGVVRPVVRANAQRSAAMTASDVGVPLRALDPRLTKFVDKEASWLIKEIAATTRDAVNDALVAGMEANESVTQIARRIAELPAFDRDRAKLVARTETTRIMNGAPTEALLETQRETGQRFTKTWVTAGDDRVRDEHAEMEDETVPIGETFSNGLMYPSEPNCRCVTINNAVEG